jgi:hypothetical protein
MVGILDGKYIAAGRKNDTNKDRPKPRIIDANDQFHQKQRTKRMGNSHARG